MNPRITVCLALLLCVSAASAFETSKRPFNEAWKRYELMLMDREFESLETEADVARKYASVVADGQPRLAALYAGASGCSTFGCRDTLGEKGWEQRLERLDEWVTAHPDSVTARVARASYYLEYGWAVRGNGFVGTVAEDAASIFRESVDRSRVELLGLPAEARDDPGWYTSLLRVARSQGWPRSVFNAVYRAAVQKYPRYLPLYFEKAQFLAPHWYGSLPELRAYIEEVTRETHPILGNTLYARLNWLNFSGKMFKTGQADWSQMKQGFERIVEENPHSWNMNNYAKFACLADDMDTFQSLTESLGEVNLEAFGGSNAGYRWCLEKLRVHGVSPK